MLATVQSFSLAVTVVMFVIGLILCFMFSQSNLLKSLCLIIHLKKPVSTITVAVFIVLLNATIYVSVFLCLSTASV